MKRSSLPCALCGGWEATVLEKESRIVGARPPAAVVRCGGCGLLRIDPPPPAEALARLYREDGLVRDYESRCGRAYVSGDLDAAPFAAARLATLERLRGGPGRLLDIGAARGVFLALARSRGWTVTGVELSDEGVRIARERFGLELKRTTLEDAAFSDASFDVTHMSHVLEHLEDPLLSLQEVRRVVRPGGIVAIEVPNEFGDLLGSVRQLLLRRPRAAYAVPSPHLYFFTPATLRRLVMRAGFRILHVETPRRDRDQGSRIPFGLLGKRAVYALEDLLRRGPLIELYAKRP